MNEQIIVRNTRDSRLDKLTVQGATYDVIATSFNRDIYLAAKVKLIAKFGFTVICETRLVFFLFALLLR